MVLSNDHLLTPVIASGGFAPLFGAQEQEQDMTTSEIRDSLTEMGFEIQHEIHGGPVKVYRITHPLLPGQTDLVEATENGLADAHRWAYWEFKNQIEAAEKAILTSRKAMHKALSGEG